MKTSVAPFAFDEVVSTAKSFVLQLTATVEMSPSTFEPLAPLTVGAFDDRQALTDWLRARTYALGPGRDHGRIMPPMS